MELFLVRHGRVEDAQHGRFYGGIEVALSPEGEQQARRAADLLRDWPVDRLWCSPLGRARYGADCVASGRAGLRPVVVEELREIDRGRWVGRHKSELLGAFPGDWEAHEADPHGWRGHGGESLGDLAARVGAFWERLEAAARRAQGRRTVHVVVSHLFPTRCLIGRARGQALEDWRSLRIPTGSVSWLRWTGAAWDVPWSGYEPDGRGFSQAFPQDFPQEA